MEAQPTNIVESPSIEETEIYDILRLAQSDWPGVYSLLYHIAIREGVSRAQILVEARDSDGKNALHYAAKRGNATMIHRMVGEVDSTVSALTKTFINEKDKNGETALHWASRDGKIDAAKALLSWEPDLAVRGIFNSSTAMDLAWLEFHDTLVEYMRPLFLYAGVRRMPPVTTPAAQPSS